MERVKHITEFGVCLIGRVRLTYSELYTACNNSFSEEDSPGKINSSSDKLGSNSTAKDLIMAQLAVKPTCKSNPCCHSKT